MTLNRCVVSGLIVGAFLISPQVRLDAGTYRVWVVGYSSNPDLVTFLINVDLWDNSCRVPLQ